MNADVRRIISLFEEISAIPRCSGNEKKLADWVIAWAGSHNLTASRDSRNNVLVLVPGSGGLESAPPVAIQGHLDMVCEKTPDSTHDFSTDGIAVIYEDDWMTADGTTLGADNGIAIAIALAIAVAEGVSHPPLELVFTVDEEAGLTGAQALDAGWLTSRRMLNLDSEDEGVFTIGCAGGLNSLLSIPISGEPPQGLYEFLKLVVSGLCGGHSGVDIHHDRANANVIVSRVLGDLLEDLHIAVAEITGGNAHNAIPRDARVVFGVPARDVEAVRSRVARWRDVLLSEYGSTDPGLALDLYNSETPDRILDADSANRIVAVLQALPHGVVRMSREADSLVETSTNLATVRTKRDAIEIDTSQRSSSESQLNALAARVAAVARLGSGTVRITSRYPPWEPQPRSKLLQTAKDTYRRTFGDDPVVEIVHAGLECSVIGAKYPGMDMISIGPTISMPHSPDERMNVPSLGKLWDFLVQLLRSLR